MATGLYLDFWVDSVTAIGSSEWQGQGRGGEEEEEEEEEEEGRRKKRTTDVPGQSDERRPRNVPGASHSVYFVLFLSLLSIIPQCGPYSSNNMRRERLVGRY